MRFGLSLPLALPLIESPNRAVRLTIISSSGDHDRHSLFGVSAHFFRTVRSSGNGQPSRFARSRMLSLLRLSAAATLMADAP